MNLVLYLAQRWLKKNAFFTCRLLEKKREVTQTVLDIKDFPKGGDVDKFLYAEVKRVLVINVLSHVSVVKRDTMFFESSMREKSVF